MTGNRKPMEGQQSLWDLGKPEKLRPCDYRFERYIGQKVNTTFGGIGVITEIDKYYTTVVIDGEDYAGTPDTISPIDEKTEPVRIPCMRQCDVAWGSLKCFLKRGYMRYDGRWCRNDKGEILISVNKECDWVPKEPEDTDNGGTDHDI